jgi:urea transporter
VLTLVSLVVAPYAWLTDHVLVIPAILLALTGSRRPARGSVTLLMTILTLTAAQMMSKSTTLYFKPDMALGFVWLTWYLYATSGTTAKKAVATSGEAAVSVPAL